MQLGINSESTEAASAAAVGSGLTQVMVVTLIIWIGLFLYVFRLDRKVRRLEGP